MVNWEKKKINNQMNCFSISLTWRSWSILRSWINPRMWQVESARDVSVSFAVLWGIFFAGNQTVNTDPCGIVSQKNKFLHGPSLHPGLSTAARDECDWLNKQNGNGCSHIAVWIRRKPLWRKIITRIPSCSMSQQQIWAIVNHQNLR